MLHVLPYAALLRLLFVASSGRTLRLRRRLQIAVGDAGNVAMLRAMRVHANFAEYVPLTLVLLVLVESSGGSALFVRLAGACLVVGRIVHAVGVSQVRERFALRVIGMVLTLGMLSAASLRLLGTTLHAPFQL